MSINTLANDDALIQDIVRMYDNWYRDEIGEFVQHFPKERSVFEVDFGTLRRALPQLADDYLNHPDDVLEALEIGLDRYDLPVDMDLSRATVRVTDIADAYPEGVVNVGEHSPGDLAYEFGIFRGQVSKRTEKKIRIEKAIYECQRCGTQVTIHQAGEGLQEPHECSGCERQGPFTLDREKSVKHGIEHQAIRLQAPPELSGVTESDTLDINLEGDLVDAAEPGDRIAVSANVEAEIDDSEDGAIMDIYGRAQNVDALEQDLNSIEASEHEDRIKEIADGNPMADIIESIEPRHHGDEKIKAAFALALFGGVKKPNPSGQATRGDVHILLVGDPGTGKSSLIRYVDDIAPRSVFTTGSGSTEAGLTCAATKDDFGSGDWTLEAGALVEAHNGVCCIDELDDMDEDDRAGLLEAMSDQRISVSKAGINATLPAESTVLGAANPEYGRFDRHKSFAEQINLDPALISRFDLIFLMQDDQDVEHDAEVAAHQTRFAEAGALNARGDQVSDDLRSEVNPKISKEVLCAYISYARDIMPVLTDAAQDRIQEEYLQLRQANDEDGPVPTNPRMTENLIRLSEARARVRLSDRVTVDDVEYVIDIYRTCMKDVGIDPESGEFDVDVIETGTSKSQRDRISSVKSLILSLQEEYDSGAPIDVVVDHPTLNEFKDDAIEHEIKNLKEQGDVYEPQSGHLRTT